MVMLTSVIPFRCYGTGRSDQSAGQTCNRGRRVLQPCNELEERDVRGGPALLTGQHGEGGEVTVHLADDHPGANDPVYRARRNEIAAAALAWSPGEPAAADRLHATTRTRSGAPSAASSRPSTSATPCASSTRRRARRPAAATACRQLDEVTERVAPLTGWHYVPAAGLVPLREFYGSLEQRVFHSTQYVRHPAVPLYTPEPDIIHEVIGHGHLLATPTFGELHRQAGEATNRLRDEENVCVPVARSSGSRSSSASSSRTASCAPTAPGSCRATARSTSSARWSTARSTSPRWAPPSTTSRTTSRSSTGRSRSRRSSTSSAASSTTCTDDSIAALRRGAKAVA